MPFIFSEGFLNLVLFNPKQSSIFESSISIGEVNLYAPIFLISCFYLYVITLRKINFDLVFYFIGILFSVLIFLIFPSPSWYIWLVPFISVLFAEKYYDFKHVIIFIIFSVFYLIFFVFFYNSDYSSIYFLGSQLHNFSEYVFYSDISFTLLESSLILIMALLYINGVKSNSFYNKQNNFIIGIAGDSASGKTKFYKKITTIFSDKLLHIEGDGDHKWERGNINWQRLTHLDPKANNIHNQAYALSELKNNKAVYRSDYNHNNGKFNKPVLVKPKDIITLTGLHPFYLPVQRKICDLKIFLDTQEELRKLWKIKRDTQNRGYSIEEVLSQIKSRSKDSLMHIIPQKKF